MRAIDLTATFTPDTETGSSGSAIAPILAKLGTFARAVPAGYGIDESFAREIHLIYPTMGFNHLVVRGILQPLERIAAGNHDGIAVSLAGSAAEVAASSGDRFFEPEKARAMFSEEAIARLRHCVGISRHVVQSEMKGLPLSEAIGKSDLAIAQQSVVDIAHALKTLVALHPGVAGLQQLADDFVSVSAYFTERSKVWMPQLKDQAPAPAPQA